MNILKLRLTPALCESPETGTPVREVWKTLRAAAGDWETLAARTGWNLPELRAIDAYHESPARYYYPSQAETENLFCAEGKFTFLGSCSGHYPLAERCPLVAFARN